MMDLFRAVATTRFGAWLVEFQAAALILLFVTSIVMVCNRRGAGRVMTGWCATIALFSLGAWLAVPDRPVLKRLDVLSEASATARHASPVAEEEDAVGNATGPLQSADAVVEFVPSPAMRVEAAATAPLGQDAASVQAADTGTDYAVALTYFVLIWFVSFTGVTVWNVLGRVALFRLRLRSRPLPDGLRPLLESVNRRQTKAQVWMSPCVSNAIAVGAWRPRIVVPDSLEHASPAEARAVLSHELAHVRNLDLWLLAMLRVMAPFVAIQPLFWFVRQRIRESQELLADREAAGQQPTEYAALLVSWARRSAERGTSVGDRIVPAVGIMPLSQTSRRVMALIDSRIPLRVSCSKRLLVALVAVLSGLSAAAAAITLQAEVSQESVPESTTATGRNAVEGRVLDANGSAVANARVLLRERPIGWDGSSWLPSRSRDLAWAQTDSSGRFAFPDVSKLGCRKEYLGVNGPQIQRAAGPFDVIAFAEGQALGHVIATGGSPATVRLPKTRELSGRILTNAGEPVARVKVRVVQLSRLDKPIRGGSSGASRPVMDEQFVDLRYAGQKAGFVETDADGRFSGLAAPADRCVALEASHADYVRREFFCATTSRPQEDVRFVSQHSRQLITEPVHLGEPTVRLTRAAEIHVTVLFADTKQPAVGARIDPGPVFGDDAFTVNESGEYRIRQLPAISTGFQVYPPDGRPYLGAYESVREVKVGGVVRRTIHLRQAAVISGQVVDATTKKPIPGADVFCAAATDGAFMSRNETDDTGRFSIRIPAKDVFVFVGGPVPGYQTAVRTGTSRTSRPGHAVSVSPTIGKPIDQLLIELQPAPVVRGRCVDPRGRALSGVEVLTTEHAAGAGIRRFKTNDDGTFELTDLFSQPPRAEDEYVAVAFQPARRLAVQFRIRREHTSKELVVSLQPMETVEGRVMSTTGKPVPDATVTLTGDWFNNRRMNRGRNSVKKSDEDGRFTFDRLIPAVRHHVHAKKKGYKDEGSLSSVTKDGDRLSVSVDPLQPTVVAMKPDIPPTQGMKPDDAFELLSKGLPGRFREDYPNGFEQYLLDVETWSRELYELAKRHQGTEIAFQSCTRILDVPYRWEQEAQAVRSLQRQAGRILITDFANRKELGRYVHRLVNDDRDRSKETARTLIAENTHPEVAGVALWLLSQLENHASMERLRKIRDEYGNVGYFSGTLGDEARKAIRVKTYYSPGRVPKDIVGKTLDGNRLKLSDHKGKVIVIWFWAEWSIGADGVAERMDQLNRISRTLKGRPFQVLGVAMDGRARAKSAVARAKTEWPSWHDGQRGRGPINREWGVRGNRMVLIDHSGRIISSNISPHQLDTAITNAITEAERRD